VFGSRCLDIFFRNETQMPPMRWHHGATIVKEDAMRNFLIATLAASVLAAALPASAQVNSNRSGGYRWTQPGQVYVNPNSQGGWTGMTRDPDPFINDYLRHDPPNNHGD
jgi:hypothetical protein